MEGPSSAGKTALFGRNLIIFPKIKAMLEEYVGSIFRIQTGIFSHKSTPSIAQSVNSCKSLPLRVDQVPDIHLVDLSVVSNFSEK